MLYYLQYKFIFGMLTNYIALYKYSPYVSVYTDNATQAANCMHLCSLDSSSRFSLSNNFESLAEEHDVVQSGSAFLKGITVKLAGYLASS